jgi:hypothetical protein
MSDLGRILLEAIARQAIDEPRLALIPSFDELLARAEYEVDEPEHVGTTWDMLPPRTRGRRIRRMRAILDALETQSVDSPMVALVARARR